jgi:hypothetical protein
MVARVRRRRDGDEVMGEGYQENLMCRDGPCTASRREESLPYVFAEHGSWRSSVFMNR